jgi:glyoxylase-like metal-dependent hydrolase (beta-lactamase superfamily II)
MEIDEGVHAIESLGVGRAYIYQEQDRLTLIDTGLPNSTDKIFAVIGKIGRKPEDLRQIFITHHHNDHTGSLAEVIERSNATVFAHKIEAPVIRGDQPPHEPDANTLRTLLKPIMGSTTATADPARVDRELEEGDEVDLGGGAKVLHVPGHTMGSAALYIPKHKMLFAGDAAVSTLGLGPPSGPFGMFNENRDQAIASFKKLAELDFDRAFFGHGKPLDGEASLLFRRAVDQLDY